MTVRARMSLVTIGVRDLDALTAFYVAIGFQLSGASVAGEVSFLRTGGPVLALWGVDDLVADAGVTAPAPGFHGVAYAMNLDSPADVDAALHRAAELGGAVLKAAVATDWGGYSGYFADPEGNLWEVAHNPHWPLDERGMPVLP